jgi:glycosyltransferase involved in cell wall biosynthesis
MKGRILFLVEGSTENGCSPAARFRVLQFLPRYAEAGWDARALWSFPKKYFAAREWFRKIRPYGFLFYPVAAAGVAIMAVHRFFQVLVFAPFSDIVFVQRNLLPVRCYPVLEWMASRMCGKMIFDFDDAIFSHPGNPARRYGDIPRILGFSDEVVCGNRYLADYAKDHCRSVSVIPTVPHGLPPRDRSPGGDAVVLGWIGTSPNIPYLETVSGALAAVSGKTPIRVLTVCDSPVRLPAGVDHRHLPWSLENEEKFFREIDVGLMPLPEDAWTLGKCSFKAIQYISCGIPVVLSPVGMNREVAPEGSGVFFASGEADWEAALLRLCRSAAFREEAGRKGRELALREFSPDAVAEAYLGIFRRLLENAGRRPA